MAFFLFLSSALCSRSSLLEALRAIAADLKEIESSACPDNCLSCPNSYASRVGPYCTNTCIITGKNDAGDTCCSVCESMPAPDYLDCFGCIGATLTPTHAPTGIHCGTGTYDLTWSNVTSLATCPGSSKCAMTAAGDYCNRKEIADPTPGDIGDPYEMTCSCVDPCHGATRENLCNGHGDPVDVSTHVKGLPDWAYTPKCGCKCDGGSYPDIAYTGDKCQTQCIPQETGIGAGPECGGSWKVAPCCSGVCVDDGMGDFFCRPESCKNYDCYWCLICNKDCCGTSWPAP